MLHARWVCGEAKEKRRDTKRSRIPIRFEALKHVG